MKIIKKLLKFLTEQEEDNVLIGELIMISPSTYQKPCGCLFRMGNEMSDNMIKNTNINVCKKCGKEYEITNEK